MLLSTSKVKDEMSSPPRIFKAMGIDAEMFSPATRDLISKLDDTPGSRRLVAELQRCTKVEPGLPGPLSAYL